MVFRIKLDGYRAIAVKADGRVNLFSRRRKSFDHHYPLIVEALGELSEGTVVDGEIVALDDSGRPDFNQLQNFRSEASRIHYFIFDLLICQDRDLTRLPLSERRSLMKSHLKLRSPRIRIAEQFEVSASDMLAAVRQQQLEGVMIGCNHPLPIGDRLASIEGHAKRRRLVETVNPERPKVESPRQPSLFELEKPPEPASRPFSLPGIFLGTSSFTAAGWEGSFYPIGMRSKDFLRHYASQFQTVEIDSTFYGTPSASTVTSWNERTPQDFIFAVKVPQVITHEKVLVDCQPEFDEFIQRMHLLGDKLGPMLLQFPKFDKWALKSPDEFRARLQQFFKRAADLKAGRFAVEVRNKDWLDARLTDLLREHNVALALTDTSFMPRPWEMKGALDLVTADFTYVRWLGNRNAIEEQTTTWDKTVIDRQSDLKSWVTVLRRLVEDKRIRKIFAFANNHYAGHAPATVKLFMDLWNDKK